MRKYEIGIGIGYDRHGVALDRDQQFVATDSGDELLNDWFGGYTAIEVLGAWTNDQGNIVREPGLIFIVHTHEHAGVIDSAADAIARIFNQQAVVVTYHDGSSRFHEPDYSIEDSPPLDANDDVPLEDILADEHAPCEDGLYENYQTRHAQQ